MPSQTAGQKVSKKLPKRVGNDKLKARRAASWLRSKDRKRKRQAAQEIRHKANLKRHENGELTPWEQAKAKAKARKAVIDTPKEEAAA